jgi:hypothetical protein
MLRQCSRWDEGHRWQLVWFGKQWLKFVARQNQKRTPDIDRQWAQHCQLAREGDAAFDEASPHKIEVITFLEFAIRQYCC